MDIGNKTRFHGEIMKIIEKKYMYMWLMYASHMATSFKSMDKRQIRNHSKIQNYFNTNTRLVYLSLPYSHIS